MTALTEAITEQYRNAVDHATHYWNTHFDTGSDSAKEKADWWSAQADEAAAYYAEKTGVSVEVAKHHLYTTI